MPARAGVARLFPVIGSRAEWGMFARNVDVRGLRCYTGQENGEPCGPLAEKVTTIFSIPCCTVCRLFRILFQFLGYRV